MKILKFVFSISQLFFITFNIYAQQQNPPLMDSLGLFRKDAELKKISDQFSFTEGPAADKAGNIYFTDQPNDKIWRYSNSGELTVFMDKTGRSNGLAFDKKGNLIACADEKNELWSITIDKKTTVLFTDFQGKKLNGPNDLWINSKGGIYFTDPYYQRDYWERKKPELDGQKVYYLPPGKKDAVIVDSLLLQPNGITGSGDGKYLYVADIRDNKTYRYDIQKNGTLANRKLFVAQGSDGITTDNRGNLYLSGRGITVFNTEGIKIAYLPVPSRWVGNLCFGGIGRNILFITASESVYTIETTVKGSD